VNLQYRNIKHQAVKSPLYTHKTTTCIHSPVNNKYHMIYKCIYTLIKR